MSFLRPASATYSSKKTLCKLEIRTDTDFVMYHGSADVTGPQTLAGRIVLMISEPMETKEIEVQLVGKRETSHVLTQKERDAGLVSQAFKGSLRTKHTFHYESKYIQSKPMKLQSGNHEFPFAFELPGNACESIEGFSFDPIRPLFQVYQLRAIVWRRFFWHDDLLKEKHVRVIRTIGNRLQDTLDPELFEVAGISKEWKNKIVYDISIPSKSLVYGDKVTVSFALTPLVDKLRIGRIRFYIREVLQIKTEPGLQNVPPYDYGEFWQEEDQRLGHNYDPPEEMQETTHPILQIPQKEFSMTFELPPSLKYCRQSVENGEWIRINHWLHIDVELHNADGHTSELKTYWPIRLYISPDLPIGNNNTVTTPTRPIGGESLNDEAVQIPPRYSIHNTDRTLNPFYEIDPSGFITPVVRSGAATPLHGNASLDHLPLPASSTSDGQQIPQPDDISARLETLQLQTHGQENQAPTGAIQDTGYDMGALQRVTSYNTAVRTPEPARFANLPPTYEEVTRGAPDSGAGAGAVHVEHRSDSMPHSSGSAQQSSSQG